MTAETLAIALVVLVGATVIGMVKEFFANPWDTQEGVVYIEHRVHEPVTVPTLQPVAQPQPRLVAYPAPRRVALPAPEPEPALLAAD